MTGRLRQLAAQAGKRPPVGREAGPAGRAAQEPAGQCELCAEPLPAVHRHLLELPVRELRCACRACQVLFDHAAVAGGHYRLVPERRRRLTGFTMDAPSWARLRPPVRTTFLVHDSATGETSPYYPSPAGAVRAPGDQAAWDRLRLDNPVLDGLLPDVEALLADRDHGAWIVPIDDCYALVGGVRARWRGLTGGQDVRDHITRFFTDLADRSTAVPATDRSPG
ncbi:DUF5947 family protein [Nonomuraea sp. NPDC046802]|uniref:DUF5947 family protein n=1 Tax=Nonomuraea sp. NPDC046802 TaxID=3154919 RepID=UPI0033C0CD46